MIKLINAISSALVVLILFLAIIAVIYLIEQMVNQVF